MKNQRIEKITDKLETMDVKGQGCLDDCVDWYGNTSGKSGCYTVLSPKFTPLW